jgi:hypothetical protein
MPAKPPRLVGVTLITLGVLTIACLNLLRLVLSLKEWQFLSSVESVSPLYQALTGLLWAASGFVLFWGLWRRKPWAPRAARWGALLYALYYWLDRLVLSGWLKSGQPPANLVFALSLTLILLAFVFWTLSRPKIKVIYGKPYGELHERSS